MLYGQNIIYVLRQGRSHVALVLYQRRRSGSGFHWLLGLTIGDYVILLWFSDSLA